MTLHSIVSVIVGAVFCIGAAMGFRDLGMSVRTGVLHLPPYFMLKGKLAFRRQDQPQSFWAGVVSLFAVSLVWAVVGSVLVVLFFKR